MMFTRRGIINLSINILAFQILSIFRMICNKLITKNQTELNPFFSALNNLNTLIADFTNINLSVCFSNLFLIIIIFNIKTGIPL